MYKKLFNPLYIYAIFASLLINNSIVAQTEVDSQTIPQEKITSDKTDHQDIPFNPEVNKGVLKKD